MVKNALSPIEVNPVESRRQNLQRLGRFARYAGLAFLLEACGTQARPEHPNKGEEISMTQNLSLGAGDEAAFGAANDVRRTGNKQSLDGYGLRGSAEEVTANELQLYWYADGQGGYLQNPQGWVYYRTAEPPQPVPVKAYLLPRENYENPQVYDTMIATLGEVARDSTKQVMISVGCTNGFRDQKPLVYLTDCHIADPNPLP